MNIITDREARANEILLHAIYEGTGCLNGKRVRVVRGRKIPKGTEGVVHYTFAKWYRVPVHYVILRCDDGHTTTVAERNVEVIA
jgi:hypothetical protein